MFLIVKESGVLSLRDTEDFKVFCIVLQSTGIDLPAEFRAIASEAGKGHYWLDADAVMALSDRAGDEDWRARFWKMLESAEPYGFSDLQNRKIKAHIAE